MKIAITLVHNKTDSENVAQIEAAKLLVDEVKVPAFTNDESGTSVPIVDPESGIQKQILIGYKIKNLAIDHMVKFFQVFPYGVTPPANYNDIDSHKVFYGKGDEDKTNDHPRFFNWGLKRGTDNGADISVYLSDPAALTSTKVRTALNGLKNDTEFIEEAWGKIGTLKLLREVGQLKEDRSLTQAITDLKTRVVEKGLKNG